MRYLFEMLGHWTHYIWHMFRRALEPQRWLRWPRKLFTLSIPAIAAFSTFLFLSLVVAVVFLLYVWGNDNISAQFWWGGLPGAIALVVAISVVMYYVVHVWRQDEYETFEDITTAWEAGIAEMERHGLEIDRIPLFLVIGGESNERSHRLMSASNLEFAVSQVPAGRSAMHWYANQDAVFVVLSGVGCLTQLSREAANQLLESRVQVTAAGPSSHQDISATCWPTDDPEEVAGGGEPEVAEPNLPDIGGTMYVDVGRNDMAEVGKQLSVRQDIGLSRESLELEQARMEHVCRLLVKARQPYAPINGVVTLLPLNLVLCDNSEGADIKEAVKRDLDTAVRCLRLRCPTFVVVNGWEDDTGFQELIRRLGPRHQMSNRFGKGAEVWDPPTPDRLEAIGQHACGAFEDWIYHLFRQQDALKKPGNRALYSLLCKIRRYLRPRLLRVLSEGYNCDLDGRELDDVELFGGCYFVATGRDAGRRAFTPKVFDRIVKEQRELEWTGDAARSDRSFRSVAYFGFAASLLCVVATAVLGILWQQGLLTPGG